MLPVYAVRTPRPEYLVIQFREVDEDSVCYVYHVLEGRVHGTAPPNVHSPLLAVLASRRPHSV